MYQLADGTVVYIVFVVGTRDAARVFLDAALGRAAFRNCHRRDGEWQRPNHRCRRSVHGDGRTLGQFTLTDPLACLPGADTSRQERT